VESNILDHPVEKSYQKQYGRSVIIFRIIANFGADVTNSVGDR